MLFLMLPCWCLTLPLRRGVASHRVTCQRIARYVGADWESLHREHIARCHSPPRTSSRIESYNQDPVSIRRALHSGRCGEFVAPADVERRFETTIGIAQLGRNFCPLLLRNTVHFLKGRSSVQR